MRILPVTEACIRPILSRSVTALVCGVLAAACAADPEAMADATVGSPLDAVVVENVSADGEDTSGNEELCVSLTSPTPIVLDRVEVEGQVAFDGPIQVDASGNTPGLCARGCWCFRPSDNEVVLTLGDEVRRVSIGGRSCCG